MRRAVLPIPPARIAGLADADAWQLRGHEIRRDVGR